jgi:hypothetical protein
MLKIDIGTASNYLIATLKEKSVSVSPIYHFELFNFYTNTTYFWNGIAPAVTNTRADVFILDLSQEFNGKTPTVGQYKYQFFEMIGSTASGFTYSLCEVGMANVINSATYSQDVFIQPDETDDDYITL